MNDGKTITLLTDFGTKDPYVGIMKGVILGINPHVTVIDITHEIEPHDIREAAFLLNESFRFFEKGTIHVAVVDPTVGTARRAVVARTEDYFFIGPDNGIFSFFLDRVTEAYSITNTQFMLPFISSTFHGRDIFAPVAAHLSLDFHPSVFGSRAKDLFRLQGLLPEIEGQVMKGYIIRYDHFGNAITNISGSALRDFVKGRPYRVEAGTLSLRELGDTFADFEISCLVGSSGYLECVLNMGSFQAHTGYLKGQEVRITIL